MCNFVIICFSPLPCDYTLEEERVNLSAFCTFVRFALVRFCLFPLPLYVLDGLRLVTVALPGLRSYLFLIFSADSYISKVIFKGNLHFLSLF